MRFKSPLLMMSLIAASFGVSQAAPMRRIVPQGEVSFTSKSYGFATWLPLQPIESQWVFIASQGASNVVQAQLTPVHQFKADSKSVVYKILVVSHPLGADLSKLISTLDKEQEKLLKSYKGELKTIENLQFDEFEGRDLTLTTNVPSQRIRARIYLTPKKVFKIVAICTEASLQEQAAQIDRVFDSFHILPE